MESLKNNYYDLQEKNVLVTGTSKGLGEQISLRMLEEGAHVVGTSRSGPPESFKPYIDDNRADYKLGDLANNSKQLVDEVYENNDGFEVLVNNAGSFASDFFTNIESDRVKRDIELDLVSPLLLHHNWLEAYNAQPDSRKPELSVNICSISSFYAWPGGTAYQAAKSGLAAAIYGMRAMQSHLNNDASETVKQKVGAISEVKSRYLAIYPDNIATGLISRAQKESLYRVRGDKLPPNMVVDVVMRAVKGEGKFGQYDDIAILVNPNDPKTNDSLAGVYAAFIPIDKETNRPNFANRILEKIAEQDILVKESESNND